jgi:hypothetical protein
MLGKQGRRVLEVRLLDVEQEILLIPPLDARMVPEVSAKAIDRQVAALPEELCPVTGPLLVDVLGAALTGHGGGEQHHGRQSGEGGHERRRVLRRQMLGHLEGHAEVGPSAGRERLAQVVGHEPLLRNLQ